MIELHARESASLGSGRKSGEQKQAVGRSRGGRNTKIHALADAQGRLLAILLTGGEAHDCPVAERLIRRVKPAKRMLGDKAYDSAELREELDERGTKPVIPNRCSRKQPFTIQQASLQAALAHRDCVQPVEGLPGASQPATTGSREITWLQSALPPLSYGGFNVFSTLVRRHALKNRPSVGVSLQDHRSCGRGDSVCL